MSARPITRLGDEWWLGEPSESGPAAKIDPVGIHWRIDDSWIVSAWESVQWLRLEAPVARMPFPQLRAWLPLALAGLGLWWDPAEPPRVTLIAGTEDGVFSGSGPAHQSTGYSQRFVTHDASLVESMPTIDALERRRLLASQE